MRKRIFRQTLSMVTSILLVGSGLAGQSGWKPARAETAYASLAETDPWPYGDTNASGEVDAADALQALQNATQKITFNTRQRLSADVNADGSVTATDALLILQHATRKISSFPAQTKEAEMVKLSQYIHMAVGTSNGTNTVIGPQRPNASVNPSPDGPGYAANGYTKGDIRGFSQIHVSGTGVPKYGQVLLSPQIGLSTRLDGHDSAKENERTSCSEYAVTLSKWDIDCAFTCTENTSFYTFCYPQSEDASLLIDLAHNNGENNNKGHHTGIYNTSSDIQLSIGADEKGQVSISGSGYYEGGWGQPHSVYFYAVTDTQPKEYGVYDGDGTHKGQQHLTPTTITSEEQRMKGLGAYMRFDTQPDQVVSVKVAMSLKSVEQAKRYLDTEIPDWDYDGVRKTTERLWDTELNRIVIDGTGLTEQQKTIFYTAMYHAMVMPRYRTGDIEKYGDAVMLDDHFAGWDTFRTVMPLHTLIRPSFMQDVINSFITRYEKNGYVRDSMTGGNDMYEQQGGDNVDVMIADAYQKLKDQPYDIDWKKAYQIVRNHADNYRLSWQGKDNAFANNVIPDPNASYKTLGYIPGDDPLEKIMCCNYTLDYAYNDFCAALMAEDLGTPEEYTRYLTRSGNWENLWNPQLTYGDYTGFIGPRAKNGDFINIDVGRNWGSWHEYFYEANSYNYSFYVPQNPQRLIELCGGEDAFCERLYNGIMKGQVDFGNEPAFLSAFLFAYTGKPYLTADCVAKVRSRFTLSGNGGNDDSGALSAWYMFTTLGFFPCAGQDFYYLTSPGVEQAVIHLENGKDITVHAQNFSANNPYIQSVTINGERYYGNTIPHDLIANGADIEFEMGSRRVDYTRDVIWCDVDFVTTGGTATVSQSVEQGHLLEQPVKPTRKGYRFVGWSRDAAGKTPWDFAVDTVTQNMTLYAQWEAASVEATEDITLKALEKIENLSKHTLSENTDDWAFFGYKNAVKDADGVGIFSGDVTTVSGDMNEENMQAYNAGHSPYFSWSGGTPTASATDVRYIIWNDTGLQIPLHIPAGEWEIALYISGVRADAYIEVENAEGTVFSREDLWKKASGRSYYKAVYRFNGEHDADYHIRLMVDGENCMAANYSVSLFGATAKKIQPQT